MGSARGLQVAAGILGISSGNREFCNEFAPRCWASGSVGPVGPDF